MEERPKVCLPITASTQELINFSSFWSAPNIFDTSTNFHNGRSLPIVWNILYSFRNAPLRLYLSFDIKIYYWQMQHFVNDIQISKCYLNINISLADLLHKVEIIYQLMLQFQNTSKLYIQTDWIRTNSAEI